MGAGDGYEGGDTAEAGLPNVTGSVTKGLFDNAAGSGVFGVTKSSQMFSGPSSNYSNFYTRDFTFDASRSNSIYGNSNTVQPPAYYVYIWRRAS